jgi:hypothetical protein
MQVHISLKCHIHASFKNTGRSAKKPTSFDSFFASMSVVVRSSLTWAETISSVVTANGSESNESGLRVITASKRGKGIQPEINLHEI